MPSLSRTPIFTRRWWKGRVRSRRQSTAAADKQWIMRTDPAIELWHGETKTLGNVVTLVRYGGHLRRHRAAFGRWARHRLRRRHLHHDDRSQVAFVYAQLSEFHSVVGARRRTHRR